MALPKAPSAGPHRRHRAPEARSAPAIGQGAEDEVMTVGRKVRIPGFRVDKHGKVVRCTKHLDASTRLKRRGSKRVKVVKRGVI
jgi:hypothetical protein